MSCVISRWSPDLVFVVFVTTESNPSQCPFTLDDMFFLLSMGGRDSLIMCGWGCCPWGQETTCERGPIWRTLSATHGGEKNLEGMGKATIHRAKSLHTREDNIMPVVNGWMPWPVYVIVWYICNNLSYIRYYGFRNYIVNAHRL